MEYFTKYGGSMFQIVKVMKFKKEAIRGIDIHDRRLKIEKSSNKDIDPARTYLNYNLANECSGTFYSRVKSRIDELDLKKKPRNDAVYMAQIMISASPEYFDNLSEIEEKAFFKDAFEFLKNRFGAENVVSAYVHKDEKTPHLHFNFVPVYEKKLCCKKVLNQYGLSKLHDELNKQVTKKYGLERGVVGGQGKAYGLHEFKQITNERKKLEFEKNKREKAFNYIKDYRDRVGLENTKTLKVSKENIQTLSECLNASLSKVLTQYQEIEALKKDVKHWRSMSADDFENMAYLLKKTNSKNYDDFKSKQKPVKKSKKTGLSVER